MKNKHDYSTLIIIAALAVTVARYVGAFVASDVGIISGVWSTALTVLMALSGIGMGVLDVLGLAYVFDGWRRALPKMGDRWSSRFIVLTAFVAGLFVAGLAILTPFTVSRIKAEGMAQVMPGGWAYAWALAVNLAPILIIGGVTFSQSGFVTVKQDASTMQASSKHNASIIQAEEILSLHECKKCGETFGSLPELASHSRWSHPKNGAIPANSNGHAKG